nr:hypothetical protein GCM10020185_57370 [Pseudomonas brassicacearum subsp. brassicacearum]
MSQQIFFAHANGFPSATYGKLFAALAPQYQVAHLELHGHDPRFPVDDNWHNLVDELIHHLELQPAPVWGVGHSLGGVLHLHAALRCPPVVSRRGHARFAGADPYRPVGDPGRQAPGLHRPPDTRGPDPGSA